MKLSQLANSGRCPELPLTLQLPNGELRILSWLRVLPSKRYVAEAVWITPSSEETVLVKLYCGARAKIKMQAELRGCKKLQQASLPTPILIDSGVTEAVAWLLLQWLPSAMTLGEKLRVTVDDCSRASVSMPAELAMVIQLLAAMHNKHLQQADLHLDNFICSKGDWYLIDAAEIEPVTNISREKNLAMLLAQLPHAWWSVAIASYGELDQAQVIVEARKHRLWRARDLVAKSGRDCSLFQFQQDFRQQRVLWRREAASLVPLLDSIEAAMASGQMLKDGGSSTVVLVDWQGQPLVIKRYNVKGLGHFLRRCLRPSRAIHSWQQGHLWRVLELPTAKPLAVIEKRWGPLRLGGYLITEYTPGEDIIGAFEGTGSENLVAQMSILLGRMGDYYLSHGDLKGSNALVTEQGLSFIDLDAAHQHVKLISWKKAFSRDLGRLQRNWPGKSSCYERVATTVASIKSRLLS
jgi:tRNA A-37 threonylcarbamoyl transferase component Bud32